MSSCSGASPSGPLAWRASCAPWSRPRARSVAVICYLGLPLPYGALGSGRWDGLVAYAAFPFIALRLARASGQPPFEVEPGPRWRSRHLGQVAVLGAIIAAAAGFAPAVVPLVLLAALAWPIGALLVSGRDAGWRVVVVGIEAVAVALLLDAPWVIGTALAGKASVQIFGLPIAGATAPDWGEVIRFAIGPVAQSPLVWLLVAGAAMPLVLGRGVRLQWAARLWVMALGSWVLALAASRGDLGRFTPSESVVLAPAALAVAACIGLGISAFENDLTGRVFGWRQVVSVVAVVFVGVGLLPVAAGAVGGRWGLPSTGAEQPLAFLTRPSTAGVARVLWLGDPRALPVGGWSLEPGLAYALTPEDLPDATQVFTPAGPGPASLAGDAVRLAVSGGTVHLGRLLAPAGVRYVVIVDGIAPATSGSATVTAPPPPGLQRDLLEQDDLQVVPGVLGVQVYENSEYMPVTATRNVGLAPVTEWSYPSAPDIVGWQPALSALAAGAPAQGLVSAGTLYAGYAPAGSFAYSGPGGTATGRPAFGWAAQYATKAGPARLALSQFPLVPIGVLLEVAAWVALVAAIVGRRQHRRAAGTGGDGRGGGGGGRGVSPAHHTRERRWLALLLVVLVIGLVAGVAGNRGKPVPVRRAGVAERAGGVGGRRVVGLVLHRAVHRLRRLGRGPGPARAGQHDDAAGGGRHRHGHRHRRHRADCGVGPGSPTVVPSLTAPSSGSWEAQTVTLAGGGVSVSQTVDGTSGWSVAPCQSTTSATWYFAGGSTEGTDGLSLALLNPTSIPVVVDLSFVTPSGTVHPINYQGIVLSPGELQVEDIASEVQNMSSVSTVVATRTGRVVASELQAFSAPATGLSLLPGAIAPQAHWVIPQSQEPAGGVGELDVFNPGTQSRIGDRAPAAAVGLAPPAGRPDRAWDARGSCARARRRAFPTTPPTPRRSTPTGVRAWWWRGWCPSRRWPRRRRPDWPTRWTASPRRRHPASGSSRPPARRAAPRPAAPRPTISPWRTSPARGSSSAAFALTPSGTKLLATGVLGAGATGIVDGSALSTAGFDPIVVRASGPMGVSEDMGPTAGIGVVTMPGIPLAAQNGL